MKRAKIGRKAKINPEMAKVAEKEKLRRLYTIPSHAVNGAFITDLLFPKSTLVRLTFVESAMDLQESFPVAAVNMPIENLQQLYNLMGVVLQKARENRRLD